LVYPFFDCRESGGKDKINVFLRKDKINVIRETA
jgi:hypothetical protein